MTQAYQCALPCNSCQQTSGLPQTVSRLYQDCIRSCIITQPTLQECNLQQISWIPCIIYLKPLGFWTLTSPLGFQHPHQPTFGSQAAKLAPSSDCIRPLKNHAFLHDFWAPQLQVSQKPETSGHGLLHYIMK